MATDMKGKELSDFRRSKDWTQAAMARKLGVTQGYVSQLEQGLRTIPRKLQIKLVSLGGLNPLALPLGDPQKWLRVSDPGEELAKALGLLGYPRFSQYRGRTRLNPAELLVGSLLQSRLDARVTEALPWLVAHFPDMNWDWVLREAKLNDLQNRSGFVVRLGKQFAEISGLFAAVEALASVEEQLERSRLEKEGTLCNDGLTAVERRWLFLQRNADAAHWHLLTDLTVEKLPYAL